MARLCLRPGRIVPDACKVYKSTIPNQSVLEIVEVEIELETFIDLQRLKSNRTHIQITWGYPAYLSLTCGASNVTWILLVSLQSPSYTTWFGASWDTYIPFVTWWKLSCDTCYPFTTWWKLLCDTCYPITTWWTLSCDTIAFIPIAIETYGALLSQTY